MKAKGFRRVAISEALHVFSKGRRVILQARVKGNDADPLQAWCKTGIELNRNEVLALAAELLTALQTKPKPTSAK